MKKNNDFGSILLNRRSIREFDPSVNIPREEMLEMIQKATRAPSSVNLQPWRFAVVDSVQGKAELRPLMRWNTIQNDTSSAMVLIFGDLKCFEYGEQIYGKAVAEGKLTEEEKHKQLEEIIPEYKSFPKEKMKKVVRLDSCLAAMQFMLVARSYGYDTNPIGGFDYSQLADCVGLDKDRYVPVLVIAVGKALESGQETVRLDSEDITTFI